MRTIDKIDNRCDLAKSLAAEDIQLGDVVAVLDVIYEYPSFLWSSESHMLAPEELIRLCWRSPDAGRPLKVKAVCLPYVLVKPPKGRHQTLDIRQCRLVRLADDYAKKAWKKLRKSRKKKQS